MDLAVAVIQILLNNKKNSNKTISKHDSEQLLVH